MTSDDYAVRDSIEQTIKHIILAEKERIKQEIVRDALTEIQNEMHSNSRIEEVAQSCVLPKTRSSIMNKNQQILDTIVIDNIKGQTTKKDRNNRYFNNFNQEVVSYPVHINNKKESRAAHFENDKENNNDVSVDQRPSVSQAHRSRPKSRERKSYNAHLNQDIEEVKSEQSPSKSVNKEFKSHSKSKERLSKAATENKAQEEVKQIYEEVKTPVKKVSDAYRSRPKSNSKSRKSYAESEEIKVADPKKVKVAKEEKIKKSKGNDKEPKKAKTNIEVTPVKNLKTKSYEEPDAPFTFSRRDKDLNEEINVLYDKMRAFEREIINMFQSIRIEIDSKFKNIESRPEKSDFKAQGFNEKIDRVEQANDKVLSDLNEVYKEISYIKGVNEALEQERKRDLVVSK